MDIYGYRKTISRYKYWLRKWQNKSRFLLSPFYTWKSSREDLRVVNNDNGSFVSLYARFILILANSNLSGIALFFLQSICLTTGVAMGHETPGKRHRYGYYRKNRDPGVKSSSTRGKGRQMKRDAYNLPLSLLNLYPPGSSTSQCLLLCPTCLLSANCNSTRHSREKTYRRK